MIISSERGKKELVCLIDPRCSFGNLISCYLFFFLKDDVRILFFFFNSQRGVTATGGHKQVDFVVVVERSWHPSCFFPVISLREALLESDANFLGCL